MTLYSNEIKQLLDYYEWPKGLVVDVIEYDEHLALRLYRDNFETFDGVDKTHIAKKVGEAIYQVRQKGCPCYLEVLKNVPRG